MHYNTYHVASTHMHTQGSNVTEISIAVRIDSTPEVASPYTLTLRSVVTTSNDISPSGQATLDPQASEVKRSKSCIGYRVQLTVYCVQRCRIIGNFDPMSCLDSIFGLHT